MQVVKSLFSKNLVYRKNVSLMGTSFEISVIALDTYWADSRIKSAVAEIKRVDRLLTTLRTDSQATLINHNAGIAPVKINGELFRLIDRSLKIAGLTGGTFDITYGTNQSFDKVELNAADNTVFLKEKDMRIYFGGIAKAYAIDRAKYILQMDGVSSGVINAGGTLTAWGVQADGRDWTIGAADPEQNDKPYADYTISNMAVATAGNYTQAAPVKTVCVMGASAELAGAMVAPLLTMGAIPGTEMIIKLQQLACVFVDEYRQMFPSKYMGALN